MHRRDPRSTIEISSEDSRCVSINAPLAWRQHDDGRTQLRPRGEVDDIFVGHTDAAGRNGLADVFRLIGAVNAVQRVLAAFVKVERTRAQRILRASSNAGRVGTEPLLNLSR